MTVTGSNGGVTLTRMDAVAVVTIDRPEARNAISPATMEAIRAAVDDVARSDAHVLVITGGGDRAFVSGGDLKELAAIRSFEDATRMAQTMRSVLDDLALLPIPVIAAVNGSAYGGGAEVAVACDIRIAANDVRCAFNQVSLGIMPAWGGVERLSTLIGRSRSMLLMTTGREVHAAEALDMGLFDVVVSRADFEASWRELAARIAGAPRDALVGIKATQRAVISAVNPESATSAVKHFATTWVADRHWEMVDEAQHRRRRYQGG